MPVYNTPAAYLEAMIALGAGPDVSALGTVHRRRCQLGGHVRDAEQRWRASDSRIRFVPLTENRGIAGNTNAGCSTSRPANSSRCSTTTTRSPRSPCTSRPSDQRRSPRPTSSTPTRTSSTRRGRRVDPCFKPDWSPDTLRSHNYVCHLLTLRRALVERLGGIRAGFDGAQDYDLVPAGERAGPADRPRPAGALPLADAPRNRRPLTRTARAYVVEAGRKVLAEHLDRMQTPAAVADGPIPGTYRVIYHLPRQPLVSILIPNRDSVTLVPLHRFARAVELRRTTRCWSSKTTASSPRRSRSTAAAANDRRARIVPWDKPFNYAAVNNFGAAHARGEVLLFLNNDVEAINADWLERMVTHALRPEVGAVGAKLYYADDTIQHAGIVVGMGGVAGHAHISFPHGRPATWSGCG